MRDPVSLTRLINSQEAVVHKIDQEVRTCVGPFTFRGRMKSHAQHELNRETKLLEDYRKERDALSDKK